jgi:hypothetical protein
MHQCSECARGFVSAHEQERSERRSTPGRTGATTELAIDLPAALAPSPHSDPLRRDERYGIAEWLQKRRERLTTIRN